MNPQGTASEATTRPAPSAQQPVQHSLAAPHTGGTWKHCVSTDRFLGPPRSERRVCTSQVQNSMGSPCASMVKRLLLADMTARMNSCGLTYQPRLISTVSALLCSAGCDGYAWGARAGA